MNISFLRMYWKNISKKSEIVKGQGHMNVCLSVAKQLLYKYPEHECYFNVDEEFYKKIQDASPLMKPVLMDKLDLPPNENLRQRFVENFFRTGIERFKFAFESIETIQDIYIKAQGIVEKVIDQVKPDVILMDQLFNVPYVERRKLPWGMIVSCNPLYAQDLPNYPPAMSGLSSDAAKDGDQWTEYRKNRRAETGVFEKRQKWFDDCGVELASNDCVFYGSNYLNFYTYPKYASYFDAKQVPGRWFSGSHAVLDKKVNDAMHPTDTNQNITPVVKHPGKELLTPEFLAKPGRLLLFSMGTIVSEHLKIMNMLLDIIGQLPHKFVVSCGQKFKELKLPENCVGAKFLDQKELYPLVDAVVTHGGNNTFSELFLMHQKPFISVCYFGDQPDNSQRLNDLGLGVGMNLADFNKNSLAAAIERVTTDQEMKRRMKEAGRMSEEDKGLEKFIDELHLFLTKQKN